MEQQRQLDRMHQEREAALMQQKHDEVRIHYLGFACDGTILFCGIDNFLVGFGKMKFH